MRSLAAALVAVALLTAAAAAAAQPRPAAEPGAARVRAELQALVAEVNAALRRRDRAALERLFAEEYVWAHPSGYVDDRATFLDDELATDSAYQLGLTFEPPETLYVYGAAADVAVLRRPLHNPALPVSRGPILSTWTFAKRGGRWRIVQTQGTQLNPPRPGAAVAAALLDAYAGTYGEAGRATLLVRREGGGLVSRGVPAVNPPRRLVPVSDSVFVDKLGAETTFFRGPDGRVTHVVTRTPAGRELRRTRLP